VSIGRMKISGDREPAAGRGVLGEKNEKVVKEKKATTSPELKKKAREVRSDGEREGKGHLSHVKKRNDLNLSGGKGVSVHNRGRKKRKEIAAIASEREKGHLYRA